MSRQLLTLHHETMTVDGLSILRAVEHYHQSDKRVLSVSVPEGKKPQSLLLRSIDSQWISLHKSTSGRNAYMHEHSS